MNEHALVRLVKGISESHSRFGRQLPSAAPDSVLVEVQEFARELYGFLLPRDLVAVWEMADGLACDGVYLWPVHERRGAPFAVQGVIETNLEFREVDVPEAKTLFFVGHRDDVDNYVFNTVTGTWQTVDPYCWEDVGDEYDSFSEMMLPIFTDVLDRRGIDITEAGPYA